MSYEVAVESMVDEIIEVQSEVLNDWEIEFMENMQEIVDGSGQMTERQLTTLSKIYKKVCESDF